MRIGYCFPCRYHNESETATCSKTGCPLMPFPHVAPGEAPAPEQAAPASAPVVPASDAATAPPSSDTRPKPAYPARMSKEGFPATPGTGPSITDTVGTFHNPNPHGLFETPPDPIHPPHYHGDRVMHIIEEFGLDFLDGTILKYLLRAGHKPTSPAIEDYQKAAWYLARKIANLEK